jgi:hypothetical protein
MLMILTCLTIGVAVALTVIIDAERKKHGRDK